VVLKLPFARCSPKPSAPPPRQEHPPDEVRWLPTSGAGLVSTSRVEAATTLVVATTDKAGRKPLLLICSPGMALTLEILGGDIRLSFIFVRRLIPETNGVRPRRRWSSRYPAGRHTSPGRHVGVGLSAADGCHAQCSYSMPRRRREELTAQGA
jgi:hypothetical protein